MNPTNEQELREHIADVLAQYDRSRSTPTGDAVEIEIEASDRLVTYITAHTNAEIAKVLDRLESTAVYAEYDKAEDDVICGDVVPLDAIQAERAKLKEVK